MDTLIGFFMNVLNVHQEQQDKNLNGMFNYQN